MTGEQAYERILRVAALHTVRDVLIALFGHEGLNVDLKYVSQPLEECHQYARRGAQPGQARQYL